MKEQALRESKLAANKGGKYLTFVLDGEGYGLEILKVREINGMMPITAVPRMPDYMKGVMNLRGKVIPVIDLRLKFGMEHLDNTAETCIIVVDANGMLMGVVVDQVSEVLDIRDEEIEGAPRIGVNIDTSFILGMGKAKGSVKILLDIDKVLSDSDCTLLEESFVEETA